MNPPARLSRPTNPAVTRSAGPLIRRTHLTSARPLDQVVLLLLLTLFVPQAARAEQFSALESQLSKECNALLSTAVKSSYGWGWGEANDENDAAPRGRKPAKRAMIDVRQTAAAGLLLHMAGEQLGDEKLLKGATESARALAAVQERTGQMPALATLGATAGGHDKPAAVPSRRATSAALGLLLTVIQASEKPDERLLRSATAAAQWLCTQQTRSGGFPVAFPPGAAPREATRLLRLDTTEYRDSTAALLLAAHVLGDERFVRHSDRAIRQLLNLRIRQRGSKARFLWAPAYLPSGEPVKDNADLPYAIDAAASQHAMQTLLAACLLARNAGDASAPAHPAAKLAAPALVAAANALLDLPRSDGHWSRYYDILAGTPIEQPADTSDGEGLFDTEDDAGPSADTVWLYEVVAAAQEMESLGPGKYLDAAEAEDALFWPQHRVSIMLAGLGNGALATQFPVTAEEVEQYMKANEGMWALIEGPAPTNLSTRLERLQRLLLRVKLEQIAPPPSEE